MFHFSKTQDYRPFITNIYNGENVDHNMLLTLQELCTIYQSKGYGYFLASIYKLQSNIFLEDTRRRYIIYWILKDLELRNICRKFVLKLKNKIKDKYPQNYTLLDLQTSVHDLDIPVYIMGGKKYWVLSSGEIKKIFKRSLLINDMTEAQPKTPCNPYTNEELNLSQLMHIYMQIGHLKLNTDIHNFAKRYFDIKLFKFYNHVELTENATKEYINTMSNSELNDASNYVHESMAIILKRSDLPIDIKKSFFKKYLIGEPMNKSSPLLWKYNINIEHKQRKNKNRRVRRARRVNRS